MSDILLTPQQQAAVERIPAVIPIRFWSDHVEDGQGGYKLVDYVEWQRKGNPLAANEGKIDTYKRHEPALWAALEPYYKAWKAGEDAPVNGTPLEIWPGISKKMAEVVRANGFRTVEDLADSSDTDCDRLGMGARTLREKARAYKKIKEVEAPLAGMLVERDEKINLLQESLNDALAQLKELKARSKKGKDVTADAD